jgi:DNA-binding XRE family transcriptional regulator
MASRSRTRPRPSDGQGELEEKLRTGLSSLVQEEREARGWTQEVLAEAAGVHWTTIGKIERAVQTPSLSMLAMIGRALDLNVSQICARVLDEEATTDETTRFVASLPTADRVRLLPVLKAMADWRRAGSR